MSLKYSLVVLLLLLFCGGRLVLEQFYGDQDCEMTWMYQWPQYLVYTVVVWRVCIINNLFVKASMPMGG